MAHPNDSVSVETTKVVCAGDEESPHPRVYLALEPGGAVDCPYCGKTYVLKFQKHASGGAL
jgi:uncharacterized Zn-finger protein